MVSSHELGVTLKYSYFFAATGDDNGRKRICVSATSPFHCTMCFQWHPGWCAVVFSSHCNTSSKTAWLIVPWSFHVVCGARKVGQGNGCFVLWSRRRGTLRKHSADNDTWVFTALSCSSLFTSWLRLPEGGRCDLCEVRLEVYFCVVICVAFMYWEFSTNHTQPHTLCLLRVLIALSTVLLPYNNVQFAH